MGSESEFGPDYDPEHNVSDSDVPHTTHNNLEDASSGSYEPSVMVSEQGTNYQVQTGADKLGMDSTNLVLSTPQAVATETTPPNPYHIQVVSVTPETKCGAVSAYNTSKNTETETVVEPQQEPGGMEMDTVPEAPIRAQCIRKACVIDLKECDCGRDFSQEEIVAGDLVICCKVPGCETVWVSVDVNLLVIQ